MTVYARSDVMSVSLSRDHGGCGATHSRPVTHGSPVKVWSLQCPTCENHLRSDPKWAANTGDIPETPDEVKVREDREKKGESSHSANLESSIATLAATSDGIQKLLAIMVASQAGGDPAVAGALKLLAGVKEERLAGIDEPPMTAATHGLATLRAAAEGAKKTTKLVDLSRLPVKDLQAIARKRKVPYYGTRAQLLERLGATVD